MELVHRTHIMQVKIMNHSNSTAIGVVEAFFLHPMWSSTYQQVWPAKAQTSQQDL